MKTISQNKFKNKFLILSLICFLFSSCDVRYYAMIVNNSKKDMKIKLQYDKEALREILDENQVIPYLTNTISDTETLISLDTINLISEIKISPHDSLEIDSGRGFYPRFSQIKKITIYADKIIELQNKNEMTNSFKEKENLFIMEIN